MDTNASSCSEASQFLHALAPDNRLTFNTFQDARPRPTKDPLAHILHGTYERLAQKLSKLNDRGAGVFVMVNRGDCRGRRTENVTAVRAVFVDLDGAPLDPVLAAPVTPSIVCESSPGRYHAIWPVADMPLGEFRGAQLALAERYGGDRKMKDLPRVLRVPGYLHTKGKPFTSRLLRCEARAPSLWPELADQLSLPHAIKREKVLEPWSEGNRNDMLFRFACGLRRAGFAQEQGLRRVAVANAGRCVVPLAEQELVEIVRSAWKSELRGFAFIPYKLLDGKAFRMLPDAAKTAFLALSRQYRGSNNGLVTFTRNEAAGWGLSRHKRTIALDALSQAGLIEWTRHAKPGAPGSRATPDMFRLRWLAD